MATRKIRERIKNPDGTYDVIHKETEAGLVKMSDGNSLDTKFNAEGKVLEAVSAESANNSDKLGGKAADEFATAVQGTKADAALPKSGGAMTGVLTAGGAQADNVSQVRNVLFYPAGTNPASIPVPAKGTIVAIKK